MTISGKNDEKARAAFLKKHGALGKALLEEIGESLQEAEHLMSECYEGAYEHRLDFFEQHIETAIVIPPKFQGHFDYQACARQLLDEDYFTVEAAGRVHVFKQSAERARLVFLGEHSYELGEAVLKRAGNDVTEAWRLMTENYQGSYPDRIAFALVLFQEFFARCRASPSYDDCKRLIKRLFGYGDCFIIEADDQIHVFTCADQRPLDE